MATCTDWTLVSRKRDPVENKFRYHSSLRHNYVSVYVDNLPFEMDEVWLRQIFRGYGDVVDVYIPNKRSLRFNTKFGFVRFRSRALALSAVQDLHGLLIRDFRIQVKLARFANSSDSTNYKQMPCDFNDSHGNPVASDFQDFNIKHSRLGDANNPSFAEIVAGKKAFVTAGAGPAKTQDNRRVDCFGEKLVTKSIQCHSIGNGWLFRSAIAKIRKLVSAKDLESVFNLEKVHDVQIKAIGGRFMIITFANAETRDKILKESWVKNWFVEFQAWKGEQAKEERFVWISCFGMPLSAWSSQTFKDIGSIWGDFLEVDENTLKGGSYEKGRILIATNQFQRIEGNVELVENGMKYIVRIEEEDSFRKVESSISLAENDSMCAHDGKLSQVLKEILSIEKGSEEDPNNSSLLSSQALESFVEDSMGLQSLFHETHHVEQVEKTSSHEKLLEDDSEDSISIAKAISGGFENDDCDLVSNEPLFKYVEQIRHKKTHKIKKNNRRKTLWSKNPLKTALFHRTTSRDSTSNVARMGSKKSPDGSLNGSSHSIQKEGSSDISKRNSTLIKEARQNMKIGVRCGVKFHGRESYNIKKILELKGVEISEQEVKAAIKDLDILEGDTSISVEF